MTELYGLFTRQVDALRAGDLPLAHGIMAEIAPVYEQVTAAIRRRTDEEG